MHWLEEHAKKAVAAAKKRDDECIVRKGQLWRSGYTSRRPYMATALYVVIGRTKVRLHGESGPAAVKWGLWDGKHMVYYGGAYISTIFHLESDCYE